MAWATEQQMQAAVEWMKATDRFRKSDLYELLLFLGVSDERTDNCSAPRAYVVAGNLLKRHRESLECATGSWWSWKHLNATQMVCDTTQSR